jgi:hypothetical protein
MAVEPDKQEELTAEQIWSELDAAESAGESPPEEQQAHTESAQKQEDEVDGKAEEKAAPVQALSDEERAMLRQLPELVHLVKTTVGRVGSIQSELQKIGKAAATQAADSPTEKQIERASESPEAWKKLKEDFPDWAEGVEAYVSSRIPSSAAPDTQKIVSEAVAKARAEVVALREKEAEEELDDTRPDWREVVKGEDFAKWLSSQPAEYQQRAMSTWRPSAVLRIISDFEKASKPKPQDGAPQKRLASAAIPSGTSNKVNLTKSVDEMSPQELWAYFDEMDRRGKR